MLDMPDGIGPAGMNTAGICPKVSEAMSRPGHDLVADAEEHRRVEHVVRQADRGGHGDGVAREQRQLHAGLALGDPVAHRRHAAGDLGDAARGARRFLDQVGEAAIGLVRREHVVIGGDDADIRRRFALERRLVAAGTGGEAMGEVRAGKPGPPYPSLARGADVVEILRPPAFASPADALGHFADAGVNGHDALLMFHVIRGAAKPRPGTPRRTITGSSLVLFFSRSRVSLRSPGMTSRPYAASSCQVRPSRSISATEADGPQVPAW